MIRAESLPNASLTDQIERARQFLADHPDSPARAEVQSRLEIYLRRLDDHDIERARDYSRQYPTQFATRIERYQEYLKAHQAGGRFISEAIEAKDHILREWDAYAYRQAYDHVARASRRRRRGRPAPSRLSPRSPRRPLRRRCSQHYLDWWDKVSVPGQYRVTLRRGEVEPTVGKYFAGGAPDLGVVIEVAGTVYGPSSGDSRLAPPDLGLHVPPADHLEAGRSGHDPDHRLRLVGQRDLCAPQSTGRPAGHAALVRHDQAGQGRQDHPGFLLRFRGSLAKSTRMTGPRVLTDRSVRSVGSVRSGVGADRPAQFFLRTRSFAGLARTMMIFTPFKVRIEQAVYGSFSFWRRGYAVLASSAGCRREWLAELRMASQRLGEPPAGAIEADSLFALRIKGGPWMIVGVFPQGRDDEDRPGALAFHALFVSHFAYACAGANPFAFAGYLHRDWGPADQSRTLPTIRMAVPGKSPNTAEDPRAAPVVAALRERRRVLVQAGEPANALAPSVWQRLPYRVRCRASLATWAFDDANHFDFVALPKLTGLEPAPADLILALEPAGSS